MLEQISSTPLATAVRAGAAALVTARAHSLRGSALTAESADKVASSPVYTLLRGRDAILSAQPRLAALAATTDQTGEVESLAYFLPTPDALRKTPHLLLFQDARGRLTAAAMLFEYRTRLGHMRVFATGDGSGRRDIIAPPELRAHTAAMAARTLVELGAHIVHIAFCEVHEDTDSLRNPLTGVTPRSLLAQGTAEQAVREVLGDPDKRRANAQWALAERDIPAYLPLLSSFDATVARIGQKTRANLRYYRRRTEQDLASTFVPDVSLSLEDFLAFNRACTYAVTDELATFRFHTAQTLPNYCLRGVRDGQGRWLSLVGTRRQNRFVEIDWQMNRGDLPAYSLATVMRSYLIEHEIAVGSTRLYIEGGTPQPIGRSFLRQRIGELTVKRNSIFVRLLRRFASVIFPPKNYVGQLLTDPALRWKRW